MPVNGGLRAFLSRNGKQRKPLPMNRAVRLGARLPGADRIDLMHNRLFLGSIRLAPPAAGKEPPAQRPAGVGAVQPPGQDSIAENQS
jgi:hypothetical protein